MNQSSVYAFEYNKNHRTFSLLENGRERIVFDDFELNFRMSRMALKLGRVHPEYGDCNSDYAIKLWGIGALNTLLMSQSAGRIRTEKIGETILLSYTNDILENTFSPDQAVRLAISEIPSAKKGVFFHNRSNEFQEFDCEGLWWSQAVFANDLTSELSHDWGMLACWQYDDGMVGGVLPITNGQVLGRLRGSPDEGISIISCTGISGETIEEYPLALFAFEESVDAVIDQLFAAAKEVYPAINLRSDNLPPEPFDKLGWCSWNAFGSGVTQEDIRRTADQLKEKAIPVKYMILDDGWSEIRSKNGRENLGGGITFSDLKSFAPEPEKFPDGLKELVDYVKDAGIKSFGVWHALNGHWFGVSPASEMVKEHPDWFLKGIADTFVPAPGGAFYDAWYKELKKAGIDFLKIDNQTFHRRCLPYFKNLAEYMAGIQKDLEAASMKAGFPVIYCMATCPEILFNAGSGNLLRVSNDFIPHDAFGSRKHLVNNFYNSCWLGKVFWPDFDMFQSNDIFSETFARMLAISGSPIYTTDRPEQINPALLRRLALPGGTIPRYDDLAEVLPSRFFDNPYAQGNVLAVSARKGETVTLGLFNTTETGHACSGWIALAELGITKHCLVYSDAGKFEPHLVKIGDTIPFTLENMESDLITVAPIEEGFALIGNTDYLAAPAIIESVEQDSAGIVISLKAFGQVLAYCEQKPVSVCGGEYRWEGGILEVHADGLEVGIERC